MLNRPKSDELSNQQIERLKCFKAVDYTNSNVCVAVVINKKYMSLIHSAKELSRKWKGPKRYCIVIDELMHSVLLQIKTASDTLKQQLETIAVVGSSERLTGLWLKIGMWHLVEFQPLYINQISVKVALRSTKANRVCNIYSQISIALSSPAGPGTGVISSNSAMDGRAYPILTQSCRKRRWGK